MKIFHVLFICSLSLLTACTQQESPSEPSIALSNRLESIQRNFKANKAISYDKEVRAVFDQLEAEKGKNIPQVVASLSVQAKKGGIDGLESIALYAADEVVQSDKLTRIEKTKQLETLSKVMASSASIPTDLLIPVRKPGSTVVGRYAASTVSNFTTTILQNPNHSVVNLIHSEESCDDRGIGANRNLRRELQSISTEAVRPHRSEEECPEQTNGIYTGLGTLPEDACLEEQSDEPSRAERETAEAGHLANLVRDCFGASIGNGHPLADEGTVPKPTEVPNPTDPSARGKTSWIDRGGGNQVLIYIDAEGNFFAVEFDIVEGENEDEEYEEANTLLTEQLNTSATEQSDSQTPAPSATPPGTNPDPHTPPAAGFGPDHIDRSNPACQALIAFFDRDRNSESTLRGTQFAPRGPVINPSPEEDPSDGGSDLGPCDEPEANPHACNGFIHCTGGGFAVMNTDGSCSCTQVVAQPRRPLFQDFGADASCEEVPLPCPPEERGFVNGQCACIEADLPDGEPGGGPVDLRRR